MDWIVVKWNHPVWTLSTELEMNKMTLLKKYIKKSPHGNNHIHRFIRWESRFSLSLSLSLSFPFINARGRGREGVGWKEEEEGGVCMRVCVCVYVFIEGGGRRGVKEGKIENNDF